MAERKQPDWERIEADYRAGVLSTREIGSMHDISHTAINKRAKAHAWTKDLSAKIHAKAEALVSRQAVSSEVSSQQLATEREVIDANASQIATVRREHRTDIQRSKRIANRLLTVLEALEITEAPSSAALEAKATAASSGKPFEPAAAASLKEHTVLLRTLAETQRVLVGLEREAYGLAQFVEAPGDVRGDADPIEGAKRLAFILARAGHALDQQRGAAK
jgi:hypothetical protein